MRQMQERVRGMLRLGQVLDQRLPVLLRTALAHSFHGKELEVAMRLAGAAILARIEEPEEPFGRALGVSLIPGFQTCVCRFQVALFEEVGLGLPFCCREDEVVWDDGEFVQDEGVGWVFGREIGDQEVRGWVLEWVWFGRFRARGIAWFEIGGFLSEGWAVA